MSSFKIMQARKIHVSQIIDIWESGCKNSIDMDHDSFRSDDFKIYFKNLIQQQDDTFRVWVAVKEEREVIGWQSLTRCCHIPLLRDLEAESSTYVRRRSGEPTVGEELLTHAITHANQSQIQYIFGHITATNRAAIRLANKCGFQWVGQIPPTSKHPARAGHKLFVYRSSLNESHHT